MKIDTGLLMKELDRAESSFIGRSVAGWMSSHFASHERTGATGAVRGREPERAGPQRTRRRIRGSPRAGARADSDARPEGSPCPFPLRPSPLRAERGSKEVVYFPSCVSRIFGSLPGEPGLSTMEATLRCLEAAGYRVTIPADADALCCGLAFSSKSQQEAADASMEATLSVLAGP